MEFGKLTEKFDFLTEKVGYLAERVNTNLELIEEKMDKLKDKMKQVKRFRDCTSIKNQKPLASGGKYDLWLPEYGYVYSQCVMDSNGKGWTVILARDDSTVPHVDFDKSKKTIKLFITILLSNSIPALLTKNLKSFKITFFS